MNYKAVRRVISPVHRIEWRQIPPLKDGILPYYFISNTGQIYNTVLNRYLHFNNHTDGYLIVRLNTVNGSVDRSVHRLVMLTFVPIDNSDLYEVNHIDGNKRNNDITNLEWVNHDQNMKHASRTGLFVKRGESRENSKLTEKQVRTICEKISEGESPKQISEEMNLKDCNIDKIVMNIINRYSWKHISREYDFSHRFNRHFLFTAEQIHEICRYFEKYPEASTKEVLNHLGVKYNDDNIKNYVIAISAIRKKKNYKNICNQYNY